LGKKRRKREMTEKGNESISPPKEFIESMPWIGSKRFYNIFYEESIKEPEKFWARQAEALRWFKKWDKVLDETNPPFYKWFVNGKLNVCYNCVDRWARFQPEKLAIIWQGEPDEDVRTFTYAGLEQQVNRFAHALERFGIEKGDRVALYLPMIPELAIAMLSCAKIGAIHTVVFGGLSAEALKIRLQDSEAKLLVTANGYYRAGKVKDSLGLVKEAVKDCHNVEAVIVVKRIDKETPLPFCAECQKPVYSWWEHEMDFFDYDFPVRYEPKKMDADDILFLLYTSGSTGKPKGVIHTTGGYLVYINTTMRYVFDIRDDDVFWCTADIGWITGHSYLVYGPLSCGATVFMYEGVPDYPEPDRYWELVEKYKISIFYTAPTVIRGLIQYGTEWTQKRDLSCLRLLGSVGEPIDPKSWLWYHRNIGKERCPIIDTWWQTETGGIMLTTLPGVHSMKPGSTGFPFFGVVPEIIEHKECDEECMEPDLNRAQCAVGEMGKLMIVRPWPGMLRGLWKNPERFIKTYWHKFGKYLSGDGATKDEDNYLWVKGRIDDIILVSGHNISTAETESALISHPLVVEAAVVGKPHEIKGQEIYAFVVLKTGEPIFSETVNLLKGVLIKHVRGKLGAIYTIGEIRFVERLPKTKSGKIMRRVLRKIAAGEKNITNLGDLSTLADESVIQELIKE
jgi:acetyl-CoA synthetase